MPRILWGISRTPAPPSSYICLLPEHHYLWPLFLCLPFPAPVLCRRNHPETDLFSFYHSAYGSRLLATTWVTLHPAYLLLICAAGKQPETRLWEHPSLGLGGDAEHLPCRGGLGLGGALHISQTRLLVPVAICPVVLWACWSEAVAFWPGILYHKPLMSFIFSSCGLWLVTAPGMMRAYNPCSCAVPGSLCSKLQGHGALLRPSVPLSPLTPRPAFQSRREKKQKQKLWSREYLTDKPTLLRTMSFSDIYLFKHLNLQETVATTDRMLIFNLMFFLIILNFFIGVGQAKSLGDHCHFTYLTFYTFCLEETIYVWDLSKI